MFACCNKKMNCILSVFVLCGLSLVVTGCVSTPQMDKKPTKAVYYPLPPELPRYQFLTSFKDQDDFEEKSASSFEAFLGGKQKSRYEIKKPYGVVYQNGGIYVADNSAGDVYKWDLILSEFRS